MTFLSSLLQIAETLKKPEVEEYKTEFFKLVEGTLSVPIDLPGTQYRCGIQVKYSESWYKKIKKNSENILTFLVTSQARNNIDRLLTKLMQERRESGETYTDMLGYLMKKEDNRYLLTDKEIRDQVLTILYSGYETVSVTSMMALKYLHDHPKALEELRVCSSETQLNFSGFWRFIPVWFLITGFWLQREHLAIRDRKRPDEPLNLDDIKSMKFTRAVSIFVHKLSY